MVCHNLTIANYFLLYRCIAEEEYGQSKYIENNSVLISLCMLCMETLGWVLSLLSKSVAKLN